MNRCRVLQVIRNTLAHHAARPLGELVPLVAAQLRSSNGQLIMDDSVDVPILPLSLLAAFIDGNTSAEEEKLICETLEWDNSVLAEIMAALRSQLTSTEPPLSNDLVQRLRNQFIHVQQTNASAASSDAARSSLKENRFTNTDVVIEAVLATPPHQADSIIPAAQTEWQPASVPGALCSERPLRREKQRALLKIASLLLATSACLLVLWLGIQWISSTRDKELARDNDANIPSQPESVDRNSLPDELVHPDSQTPPFQAVDSTPNQKPNPEIPALVDDMRKNDQPPQIPPLNDPLLKDDHPKYSANDRKESALPWSQLHWNKVQGLLVKQEVSLLNGSIEPGPWMGALASGGPNAQGSVQSVRWRTFPGSHAQADLQGDGRLVLQSDTEIELLRAVDGTDQITLKHGAVAFMDMPSGWQMQIAFESLPVTALHWQGRASVILASGSDGLQAQVHGGQIDINGRVHKNALISFGRESIGRTVAVRQLPAWIARPTDLTTLPRNLLQQLTQSTNVLGELNRVVSTPLRGLDEVQLTQLRLWQADAQAGALYEAFEKGGAPLRLLVFRRALSTPLWSQAWQDFWSKLEATGEDPSRVRLLRTAVMQAQTGTRLNRDLANQVVTCLAAENRATRAVADLLLRISLVNGPTYDLDFAPQQSTRIQGLWRRLINARL